MNYFKSVLRFAKPCLLIILVSFYKSEPIFATPFKKLLQSDSSNSFEHKADALDSIWVEQQFSHVMSLLRDENNQEALELTQNLTRYAKDYQHWYFYINGLMVQANALSGLLKFDQAKALLDSSVISSIKYLGKEHRVTATALNDLALYHVAKGEYLKALDYMKKAVHIRKVVLDSNHPSIGRSLNNLASIYGYLGDHDKEIELLKESVDIKIKALGEYTDPVAIGYNNMAVAFRSKKDHRRALEYIEKVIEIDQKNLPPDHSILAQDYNSISGIYLNLNNVERAFHFLGKAMEINSKKFGDSHPRVAKNMITYADIYEQLGDFKNQFQHLQQSLQIRQKNYGENHHLIAEVYSKLGSCLLNLNQIEDARKYLQLSLESRSTVLNKDHYLIAVSHNQLSKFYLKNKKIDSALFHSQHAIAILDTTYNPQQIESLPVKNNIVSKDIYLDALKNRATCLSRLSRTVGDANFLRALETNLSITELINELRMDFESELSDKIFLDNSYAIFEKTIQQCVELNQKTNESIWIEKAFIVSEMSKSFRLSKVLNEFKAKQFARIPESLLNQEKFLKNLIQKNRADLAQTNNKKHVSDIKKRIFSYRRKLDSLINKLEKEYPKYFELKYNKTVATTQEVQQDLTKNELFLEFFIGDTNIYSFAIIKDTFKIFNYKKPTDFDYQVEQFRKSTSNYQFILDSAFYADNMYIKSASYLYDVLLKNKINSFGKEIRRIMLVPDGVLGLINFEALISANPNKTDKLNYKKLNYLINNYIISIAHSATILKQSATSNKSEYHSKEMKTYAGFAPGYESWSSNAEFLNTVINSSSLNLSIEGTKKEVEQVSRVFDGIMYLDSLATESRFKEISGDYRLLHLAMHGILSDNSQEVKLVFSDMDSVDDGLLHIPEIYNLDLNADMILLSACNSGFGKVQKGEGVLSLSRAFMYAGVPSVVMSLWALPDQVAPELITKFSKNLMNNQTKDDALRLAKTRYIQSVENKFKAHPYFWAGLVPIGDISPINNPDGNPNMAAILGLIAILLIASLTVLKKYK